MPAMLLPPLAQKSRVHAFASIGRSYGAALEPCAATILASRYAPATSKGLPA